MSWDRMMGDNQLRYCESCKLHVFNISEMDVEEAASLISKTDGRLCVRLHRRRDGTVMTRDCPVGTRMALRKAVIAASSTLALLLTGLFWAGASFFGLSRGRTDMGSPPTRIETVGEPIEHTMGAMLPPQHNTDPSGGSVEQGDIVMGKIAAPLK